MLVVPYALQLWPTVLNVHLLTHAQNVLQDTELRLIQKLVSYVQTLLIAMKINKNNAIPDMFLEEQQQHLQHVFNAEQIVLHSVKQPQIKTLGLLVTLLLTIADLVIKDGCKLQLEQHAQLNAQITAMNAKLELLQELLSANLVNVQLIIILKEMELVL